MNTALWERVIFILIDVENKVRVTVVIGLIEYAHNTVR
jgi:hypothetical protein